MTNPQGPLSLREKLGIGIRVLTSFALVEVQIRRCPLPEAVERLGRPDGGPAYPIASARLGRIVHRMLQVGPLRARCLTNALVLYRLLRRRGYPVQLVIGLPESPMNKDAHAWVELDGADVGPPPGRGTHQELARYG